MSYFTGDGFLLLLGLICTAVAIVATRWYVRTAAPAAAQQDGNEEPFDVRWVQPQAAPHEAQLPAAQEPARPDWMRGDPDELIAYAAQHRGIDDDWRHMHEAAKAGRFDVVSRLSNELRISVMLKNKRGRNILRAFLS